MLLGMPQSWACLLLARPNILELWPGWYAQDGTWGVLLAGAKENAWGPTNSPTNSTRSLRRPFDTSPPQAQAAPFGMPGSPRNGYSSTLTRNESLLRALAPAPHGATGYVPIGIISLKSLVKLTCAVVMDPSGPQSFAQT
jgi:hypothetical protein